MSEQEKALLILALVYIAVAVTVLAWQVARLVSALHGLQLGG